MLNTPGVFFTTMHFSKIVYLAFSASLVFTTSVEALPLATDPPNSETSMRIEVPPHIDSLSTIRQPMPRSPQASLIQFHPENHSGDTHPGFFRTLLSSLTYEVRFTPLGRLYTAIPQAFNTNTPAMFSSRLLPHPEKLQSTALLSHNQLIDFPRKALSPPLQEKNMFGPIFWLTLCLTLVGLLIFVKRRFIQKSILHI